MRIRGSSSISPSSSFSPSTLSLSSSTNSLPSFQSNSSSSSSMDYETRCEGLDLLVEAVLHVAGSVLGIPFTQKRVIRRRKRAFKFRNFIVNELNKKEDEEENEKKDEGIEVNLKQKRRKREMALPLKYHDSVLQPWKRSTRHRQSIEIDGSLG